MSRILRKALAVIAALALLTGTAFADASIVSPVADSVVYSDSLLISVKLTGSESVKVTVYQEYYESSPAVYELQEIPEDDASAEAAKTVSETPDSGVETVAIPEDQEAPKEGAEALPDGTGAEKAPAEETASEKTPIAENAPAGTQPEEPAEAEAPGEAPEAGNGAGDSAEEESGEPELIKVLIREAEYSPYDASALTAEDLSLLSSGRTEDASGEALTLSDGSGIPELSDVVFAPAVSYKSDSEVGFYTKQLSVQPGLYKVSVESRSGSSHCFVAVKEKQQEEKPGIFSGGAQKSGAFSFLRNMLRSLFR